MNKRRGGGRPDLRWIRRTVNSSSSIHWKPYGALFLFVSLSLSLSLCEPGCGSYILVELSDEERKHN